MDELLKRFVENWKDCETCHGKGMDPRDPDGDACRDCGGYGVEIASMGEMYSILEDAKELLKADDGN